MKAASSSFIALLIAATFVAPAAATEAMSPGYVSSSPSDGEMLDEAPERVEITFDEPLDETSSVKVSDECGRQVDDGNVDVEANTMSVGIALKPIGEYRVDYFSRGLGGVTGQESGTFDFMVHSGPSCGRKQGGGHGGGHGNNNNGGSGGGNHNGGSGGNHNGSGSHSGSGGGPQGSGTGHTSMGHSSTSRDHSSMNHTGSSSRQGSRGHGSGKHGSGKHGKDRDGSGKHGGGAHGLLDILKENEEKEERTLAAGADGLPAAPDGQAVVMALGLSLLMGVVGGWFLRVSGAR
jgi:methionine-rich copper-binding protein CopC